MEIKLTFWQLLSKYDKIEIPIIQRDYAQGRNDDDAKRIREKFIEQVLINSVLENKKIELDFVYGALMNDSYNQGAKANVFIPLDGQQRLTSLFLLHYFIALKEGRLEDNIEMFKKFTYETRPSAHSFISRLLTDVDCNDITHIVKYILDSPWYDNSWKNDNTVQGILKVLETFTLNKELTNPSNYLFDRLIDDCDELITFYFIHLDKFGLSEELYIRMNARGKMLTDFENFKSEFFKIIKYNHDLLEGVKEKIEYKWVENLWKYRIENTYVIDIPFMNFLEFITEMLYFKKGDFKGSDFEVNFLDFKVLNSIYSSEDNLKFLIHSFDSLTNFDSLCNDSWFWKKDSSIQNILSKVINGISVEISERYLLYGTLEYLSINSNRSNYVDFARVLRNLIKNTADSSRREWPKIIKSVNKLAQVNNIYEQLLEDKYIDSLEGFYLPQRKEERLKAQLIEVYGDKGKAVLFKAEDIIELEGSIFELLKVSIAKNEIEFEDIKHETYAIDRLVMTDLDNYILSYNIISQNSFNNIWGHLIDSSLYEHSIDNARVVYIENYVRSAVILFFAKRFYKFNKSIDLQLFLENLDREFVLCFENTNLHLVTDPKKQLQLYFLVHTYVNKQRSDDFFKAGYNFGWLEKETGFLSNFNNGIENCLWYPNKNPIFQTYTSQFRYNLGLNKDNVIPVEIKGHGYNVNNLEKLYNWAKN